MLPPAYVHLWEARRAVPCSSRIERYYRVEVRARSGEDLVLRASFSSWERAEAVAEAVRIAKEEGLPLTLYNVGVSSDEAQGIDVVREDRLRFRSRVVPAVLEGWDSPVACPCAVLEGAGRQVKAYCRPAHRRTCPVLRGEGPCVLLHPAGTWRSVLEQVLAAERPVDAWSLLEAAGGW